MQKTILASHVTPRSSARRRWATTACWLLSTALLALAGCAVAAGSAFASEIPIGCPLAFRSNSSVGPYSESAAQADDASLLAELPLPPGSSESATEPAEDDSLLAHPAIGPPASPNAVDEHTWWLVPVAPAEALSYICAHLPAGTTRPETIAWNPGEPNVPDNEIAVFTPPGSPSTLVIKAVQLPNLSTALRADAQVVWTTPRPASETIPSGGHLLRIAVHDRNRSSRNPQNPSRLALLERLPRQITSPRQIEGIVALLNELRVVQPGRRVCPLLEHGDSSVELTFYLYASPGAAPLAVADIESGACRGGVSLTIGGVSQPRLEGGWSLVEQIFNDDLLAFQTGAASPLLPFALWTAFPSSTAGRDSGDYYGSSAPTRRRQQTLRLACPHRWARRHRMGSHVHCCSVGGGGAQLFPCGPVVTITQPLITNPGQPGITTGTGSGRPAKDRASRAPHGPAHIHRFPGWVSSLEGVRPLVHSCCTHPPRLPGPHDPMFPHVPSLSGLLPPDPRSSGVRLPSASPGCCDSPAAGSRTPPDPTAPRGARSRP